MPDPFRQKWVGAIKIFRGIQVFFRSNYFFSATGPPVGSRWESPPPGVGRRQCVEHHIPYHTASFYKQGHARGGIP